MSRYMVCPFCGRKRVTLRLRANGEDHYGCDRCGWEAFTDGHDDADVEGRRALRVVNRHIDVAEPYGLTRPDPYVHVRPAYATYESLFLTGVCLWHGCDWTTDPDREGDTYATVKAEVAEHVTAAHLSE